VASASASLERIRTDPSLREKLWANTDYLYDGLRALGLQIGPNKTPVIGIAMPDPAACLRGWRTLLESGVYVNLALPPATPGNAALLRCSICAAHSREQLDTVLAAFKRVKTQLG
jgi:7-keto-8-aminopelargonate synthetase-like enzyme